MLLVGGLSLKAQQMGQTSQFFVNPSMYSPSLVGVNKQFEGILNYRNQWTAMNNAPKSLSLTINNPFRDKSYAVGGRITSESFGATKRNYFSLSYAYDVKISDDYVLAFGLAASLTQYRLDGTKVVLADDGDNTINTQLNMSSLSPDFNFGATLKHKDFYVGISVNNLIESKINMLKSNENRDQLPMDLARHYFIYGSYKKELDKFILTPFAVFKSATNSPYQFEVGAKALHKDSKVWAGIMYRHMDAVSAMLGYTLMDQLDLAYSYDFTISKIRQQSYGSHEISLRYFIDKSAPKQAKARMD